MSQFYSREEIIKMHPNAHTRCRIKKMAKNPKNAVFFDLTKMPEGVNYFESDRRAQ